MMVRDNRCGRMREAQSLSGAAGGYEVSVATEADAPGVTRLLETCYPPLFAKGYDEATLKIALPRMTKANPKLLASGHYFIAADARGAIIGCGGWSKERPGSIESVAGAGHVRHFATDPAHLRRGIGGAIFARCKAQALAQGIRRFDCYSSLVAVDFYRALGFSVVGPMDLNLGPDVTIPGVLMRAEFDSADPQKE
jgi:GNAT superfamily N-acetyltransferase